MARQSNLKPDTIGLKKRPQVEELEDKTSLSNGDGDEQDQHTRKKVRWCNVEEDSVVRDEDEDDDDANSEDESQSPLKVCLAASCQYGNIGCAYYDPARSRIYVLEDTQEGPHFDLTRLLLEQADPDTILTSSQADDDFMDILRDHMDVSGGSFQICRHRDFVPAKGRDRLLSLRLLSELPSEDAETVTSDLSSNTQPKNAYDFMSRQRDIGADPTLRRWNASIRISNFASIESSPLCIASVGALLDHLTRQRAVSELDDGGIEDLEILDIEVLTLDQVMQINADALFSLQIFENESHASVHSDKTKEGLSLFGILNNTKTSLGRSLLRQWLLRPSVSLPVITARHDAVAVFLRPENLVTSASMHNHLKGIKNIPGVLGSLKNGKARLIEWQSLVKVGHFGSYVDRKAKGLIVTQFCFHATMLRDALVELHQAGSVDVVQRLVTSLDIAIFKDVGTWVNEIIDWEESANARRVCVRPKIDEELDNRKYILCGLDPVLTKVAEQISLTIPPDYTSSLNVAYFPQLGFLIAIPLLDEWKGEEGIQVLDGWSFQFSSDTQVYFKSEQMHDMDTHIGDLHHAIIDREIEIVQELQVKILKYDGAMRHACDVCAELDVLLSFAEASRAYDYRRPRMVEESVIDISCGRHPLQEQAVDIFVPNPARLVGGAGIGAHISGLQEDDYREIGEIANWNSVIVCTGSNACGKSVYMKQIALIQYMSQIGCFVPAEFATLGIVDKIFTRIQTQESVSKIQSAFMIDLNQVSLALRNCTARSLIVLDEFGKGTVSTDGAGLFCGVLKELLDRGADCPKVLAATHFHEIFTADLFDSYSVPVTFLHMQVMFTTSDGDGSVSGARRGIEQAQRWEEDDDDDVMSVRPGESITYLFRVAEGLSLDSHAAKCAERFGVPRRVVDRARYVTHLLSIHELGLLLDEEMTMKEKEELKEAEAVCRRFLVCELDPETEVDGGRKEELSKVLERPEY